MQVRGDFWSGFCARARYVPDGDSKGTTALARVAPATMIDEILGELRECIELVAEAKQQSTRHGEQDVHLMRDGAHRVVAALVAAAEAIEGAG